MNEITVEQLKERMDKGDTPFLLDVRETDEREFANLGGHFIPISVLALRYQELDPNAEIIIYCHHGGRSSAAVNFLKGKGFKHVMNLIGGIDAWSVKVDPKVKRY